MVSVVCAVSGSCKDNMFSRLKNPLRRFRASLWVLRKSCCLRSTMGGMQRDDCYIGFGLGILKGSSVLRYGRCCSPVLLVIV